MNNYEKEQQDNTVKLSKKEKSIVPKMLVRWIKRIIVIVVIIALLAVLLGRFADKIFNQDILSKLPGYQKEASLTSTYIIETLSNQSELVTQKLNLEGYSEYSDEGLPVITKGDFSMTYNAEVTAGIDVKKIDVTVNDDTKTVKIKLPKAEIYSVKVDPGTIQYHDEKIALFNSDGKEDSDKAEKMAEKDAMEQARKCGLLENADKNAEVLVKGLLEGNLQGYSIEFVK